MTVRGRQWLKFVGVAGVVGVAASGAFAARRERQRRAYTPDEIREQLHRRYAAFTAAQDSANPTSGSDDSA